MTAAPTRTQPERDALRHAFRNADEADWQFLAAYLPDSGHGRFWKSVFAEVKSALSRPNQDGASNGDVGGPTK